MNRYPTLALFLLIPLFGSFLHSQSRPAIPPAPDHYVTDRTGFLSLAAQEELERNLADFERSSGCQFIIYIGRTTGGTPVEEWTVSAFEAWGIGKKGADNGLALFVFPQDRRLRIEVGYGLEGQVPDAQASRVINDIITPLLRENQPDQALRKAAGALMSMVTGKPMEASASGEYEETPKMRESARRTSPFQKIFIGLLAIGFLLLFITHPSLALYLLFSILSGGRGGGFGGGGSGGFRGGGGRSGGGGASGSW